MAKKITMNLRFEIGTYERDGLYFAAIVGDGKMIQLNTPFSSEETAIKKAQEMMDALVSAADKTMRDLGYQLDDVAKHNKKQ